MPVRKFRSVGDMDQTHWREPGDPELYEAIAALWATGAAVVICPGGGYRVVAADHEGKHIAEWLNSLGVTGIILKYRVPRRPDEPKGVPARRPLQDAQRAVSLVRSKAKEWGFGPQRIGMVGFSAGADVTARQIVMENMEEVRFRLVIAGSEVPICMAVPGRHNILNALAASSAA